MNKLNLDPWPEPDDTPEHNKLQALFLNREFQYAFIEAALDKSVYAIAQEAAQQANSLTQIALKEALQYSANLTERTQEQKETFLKNQDQAEETLIRQVDPAKPQPPHVSIEFECGFDLKLTAVWSFHMTDYRKTRNYEFRLIEREQHYVTRYFGIWETDEFKRLIELKPQLSDDFPSVLRQMKRNGADTLVIGTFESTSCTLEQVRRIFGERPIITLDQIQAIKERGVWPE